MVEQALEVARDQDVHRRRDRLEEVALAVVDARAQEVRQDVVGVRSADELVHRQAHALRVEAREDVAEVARRHGEVDGLARLDRAGREEVGVGAEVVDDLRHEAAPVDGVGRREADALLGERFIECLVAEDLLDAALCVVKVARDGRDVDVLPLLREHLQLLDAADAALRVEDHDADLRHIAEALERCLARVTRGRDENQHLILLARLLERRAHELRQELQLFLGSAEFFETIFLYQLALVDYIYTGRLHFLGTVIDVPPEARREHLRSMIEQLRRTPERLCILCTQNRVCNYDDLSVSVFVNQHAAFVLDGASGGAQPAYTVSSGAMVHQLNVWMDHFRKLPAAQRLTGQDAIDYLTRCMRLL